MRPSRSDTEHILGILTDLAAAITTIEGRQDELDKPALELTQLVGVDVQDILDTITGPTTSADPAGELAEISAWLAGHANYQPQLVAELMTVIGAAATTIGGPKVS